MNKKIKVNFEDGRQISVDYKTKAIDAVKLVENDVSDILALNINNEVKNYSYELVSNENIIKFIKLNSQDGYRIYTRTLKMVLYMALTTLYSGADVEFITTIDKDQYFTVNNIDLNEEKISAIKEKMLEIVNNDYPIIKKSVSIEEATILYTASNDADKLEHIDNRLRSNLTMYFCEGLYNYFYGILAPSTGYVKNFDIIPYRDGALLVIPDEDMKLKKKVKDNRLYDTFIEFNKLNKVIGIENVGNLNEKILNNKINTVIQVAEAIHQREMVEMVLDIEKRKNIKMILIAGPSSSGKTTFAQKLGVQLKLTGYNPITISMDNYFVERKDTPLGEDGKYNFECVEALDIELFNSQMRDLIAGKTVELPEFDFVVGTKKYKGN